MIFPVIHLLIDLNKGPQGIFISPCNFRHIFIQEIIFQKFFIGFMKPALCGEPFILFLWYRFINNIIQALRMVNEDEAKIESHRNGLTTVFTFRKIHQQFCHIQDHNTSYSAPPISRLYKVCCHPAM